MSYALTVWFNDAGISTTAITNHVTSGTNTVYGHSGDTELESTVNNDVTLTATAASGMEFYRWVYRLGSITGPVQYSYDNPFYYSGGQDIFIRAESQDAAPPPATDAGYYIRDNGQWKAAQPYIFDGTAWRPVIPCIYDGGWQQVT